MQRIDSRVDIRKIKEEFRSQSKKYRQNLSLEEKEGVEAEILNRVLNLDVVKKAKTVLCYVSTPTEVDTKKLIEKLIDHNKTVAVPKCIAGTRDMIFYIITSLDQTEKGTFGVLEPNLEKCDKLRDFRNCVCIIPGLMFDSEGYRLGYGKGYYDRFLSKFSGVKIGICFEKCYTQILPHGFYDVASDIIVTETEVRYLNNGTVKRNARK